MLMLSLVIMFNSFIVCTKLGSEMQPQQCNNQLISTIYFGNRNEDTLLFRIYLRICNLCYFYQNYSITSTCIRINSASSSSPQLNSFGVRERLSRLLSAEPSELLLEPTEALRITTEAYRLWAVAAGYGQACKLYM